MLITTLSIQSKSFAMSRITTACCSLSRRSRGHSLPFTQLRYLHRTSLSGPHGSCFYATQAPIPAAVHSQPSPTNVKPIGQNSEKAKFTPKIEDLVQNIGQLSLLEAAELVEALKSRLKITEVAVPVQAVSAGPSQSSPSAGAEAKQQKAEPEKPKEKTVFTLTLLQIDAAQKAKVIKEVKTIMPSMNLVEAKKFVESLPKQLKENGTKEEIDKLKQALESVGATVKVE